MSEQFQSQESLLPPHLESLLTEHVIAESIPDSTQVEKGWGAPTTQGYETPAMFYAGERDKALRQNSELEDKLELSKIDPVTGLKNRLALFEDLDRVFRRGPLGVLYIDVNGLSRVNKLDEKHAAGDKYLLGIAQALKLQLRFGQTIYRGEGSDEIIILAPDTDAETLSGFIERIRIVGEETVEAMNLPGGVFPGICVGGAIKQDKGDTPEKLIGRADQHCEEEKNRFYDAIHQETGRDIRR